MKCEGTLSIPYEGGKERNKWIKDELKDQALKLFKSANFIDGKPENNFSVEVEPLIIDESPSSACSHVPRSACAIAYDRRMEACHPRGSSQAEIFVRFLGL